MAQKTPNIVLICTDQMRRDCVGAFGNPEIETPALDTMKRQGCAFTRAYSAVPSCIPARAALLTGLSQEHHGRVGYRTASAGSTPIPCPENSQREGIIPSASEKCTSPPPETCWAFTTCC